MMKQLEKLVRETLELLIDRLKPNSQRAYKFAFKQWAEHIEGKWTIADAFQVQTFIAEISKRKGQAPRGKINFYSSAGATIRLKLEALRSAYTALLSRKLVKVNPFTDPSVPKSGFFKRQKRPTEMLDFDRVKELCEMPDPEALDGVRDRAMMALLFGGALRRGEVIGLRLCDCMHTVPRDAEDPGIMYVHLQDTKANIPADQALPDWAAVSVMRLLSQRLREGASELDPLLCPYRGRKNARKPLNRPLDARTFARTFARYVVKLKVGGTITPHSARATAITKLLADGIEHRKVKAFSRHSSVITVELYDKRRIGITENPALTLKY